MFLNYLFLSNKLSKFAEQAEWISQTITMQANPYPMFMHHMMKEYLTCRESIAYKFLAFEKTTHSMSGWLKSFFPGTKAFQSRAAIGNQLIGARHLYFKISANYYKSVQQLNSSQFKAKPEHQKDKQQLKPPPKIKKEESMKNMQTISIWKRLQRTELLQESDSRKDLSCRLIKSSA